MQRLAYWLVVAPFAALLTIIGTGLLGHWTGVFGPGPSNRFALFGIVLTCLGIVGGLFGLAMSGARWGVLRWLIALLYIPAVIASLLTSGM